MSTKQTNVNKYHAVCYICIEIMGSNYLAQMTQHCVGFNSNDGIVCLQSRLTSAMTGRLHSCTEEQ